MNMAVAPNADVAQALDEAKAIYAKANPNSDALYQKALPSMPGGNTRSGVYYDPFPLMFRRGEGARVLASRIDFEQFATHFVATRCLVQGLAQNFLSLCVAPVGHVDIGFGERVNLFGIDHANADLAGLFGLGNRGRTGINGLTTDRTKDRAGLGHVVYAATGSRRQGSAASATAPERQPCQTAKENDQRSADRQDIVEEEVDQSAGRLLRRGRRNRRRYGRNTCSSARVRRRRRRTGR